MTEHNSRKGSVGPRITLVTRDKGTAEPHVIAINRALACQIELAMKEGHITKAEMARRIETSRSQLNRLLDPDTESVTLDMLARAAQAVGRRVRVELV